MKKLGIIGGLGPIASAYFYELIIKMTDARTDQEHLELILYSIPSTPDRTSFLLGKSNESPVQPMAAAGKQLYKMGVECIAIPCITAHAFHKELAEAIPVPVIHIIKETGQHLHEYGITQVGIMATDGTVQSGLFQNELKKLGIHCIFPDAKNQSYVMDLIYQDIKADKPINMEKFQSVERMLRKAGAEIIILGCTELSLIKREYPLKKGFLDAMEVLARRAVLSCEAPLKGEYTCLIEKKAEI